MDLDATDFTKVVIVNGDTHAPTQLTVSCSRLAYLKTFILQVSQSDVKLPEPWGGESVDSAAVFGMQLLFDSIPHKFPVHSILLWLRDEVDPSIPLPVVEYTMSQFARLYV